MKDIKCPYDLNQFLLGEPMFENTFPEEECEQRKFYGDCFHCFATAIASRDYQLKDNIIDKIKAEIEQLPTNTRTNWDGCCPDIDYPQIEYVDVTKDKLLSIIDKYKAES